jgi:hypothetical protein
MNFRDMVDKLFHEEPSPEKSLERKIRADGHNVNELRWDTPNYQIAPVVADCALHLDQAKELGQEHEELRQLAQIHFDAALEAYRRGALP